MPSDYVAIKTFIKCDPLLVQLLYISVLYCLEERMKVSFRSGQNLAFEAIKTNYLANNIVHIQIH